MASRDGCKLDLSKACALVTALDALLAASLVEQARPLARELRAIVEAARGPQATIVDLRAKRPRF